MKRTREDDNDASTILPEAKKLKLGTNFSLLQHDGQVLMVILDFATHRQVGVWVQTCKSMAIFVQTHLPAFFRINNHTKLESNLLVFAGIGDAAAVEYLLQKKTAFSFHALHIACKHGFLNVVQELVKAGANIRAYDDDALDAACSSGNVELLKYLLLKEASMEKRLHTSVFEASRMGQVQILEHLVSIGFSVAIDAAITAAAQYNQVPTIKYLIGQGANVHYDHEDALNQASTNGHLEAVTCLIENGADVKQTDFALGYASEHGHLPVVKHLLEHGCDIHADDDYALRYASDNGHLEVVKYLVEHGATALNEALQVAQENNHENVVAYLQSAMKNDEETE